MNITAFFSVNKIIFLFVCLLLVAPVNSRELQMGSVAMDIPAAMYKRLEPLTGYLSKELGMPVSLKLSPNMAAAIDEAASAKVDISYLTPVAYIKAREKGNVRLVAKTVTKGRSSFQLMIVVADDSPIRSVQELAGKSFAFGDPAALLQRAVVVGSGVQLSSFSDYHFLGHYDNIARGVLNGDFDAGILKDTIAYKWESKGLRILYRSSQLPPYNIVVSKDVPDSLYNNIRETFLNLDVNNPVHLPVIKALSKNYTGFAATDDSEYNIVRKLVAPFSKLNKKVNQPNLESPNS